MKYHVETLVNPSQRVDTIVDAARSTIDAKLWDNIVKDIAKPAKSLKAMGYSNTKDFEHGVTNLLNLVSRAYVREVCGSTDNNAPAIVFSGPYSRETVGDYLGVCTKADTSAFMATLALLRTALAATAKRPFVSRQEWTNQIGVGEWKPKKDPKGQVLWYLSALKRFRPDIKTVYGVFIEKNTLRIMSHNACGTSESDAVAFDKVDVWIAFVVHLYHSHDSRDIRFTSKTDTPDARARWSIQTEGNTISTFRPFHAGPSPGRVTWLSFEQHDYAPQLARGFLKVSWQDASAQYHEGDLLDLAHKDGWVPGLVRPRWTHRDVSDFVGLDNAPGAPKRVKEIIRLASLGEPLSQCRSLLHLFKVVFDAIGVHDDLLRRDILHRDMSWFNILCNPWHDPETLKQKSVKKGVPCIDFILTGEESEPSALVLDLDHAAVMTQLYSKEHNPRKQKSGTPMFVAVELASSGSEASISAPNPRLYKRLRAIDDYPELIERAFPDEDGGFMDAFMRVYELEMQRSNPAPWTTTWTRIGTDPGELHRPRHDVESIFWVLFWAIMRASPSTALPAGKDADDALDVFATDMLGHRLGKERHRAMHRKEPPIEALHPVLAKFGPLLEDMATYLCIPWHLYMTAVPGLQPNHAHIAFRRMLLVEIHNLSADDATDDIPFNRKSPRRLDRNIMQDRASVPSRSIGTGSSPALTMSASLAGPSSGGSHNPSLQRAAISNLAHGSSSFAQAASDSMSQRGSKRGPDSRDFDFDSDDNAEPLAKRAKRPPKPVLKPTVDADAGRDIETLIDMFWDDRTLWFGVGDPRVNTKAAGGAHGQGSASAQADVPATVNENVAVTI